jgi:hypothetical protein
MIFATLVRSMQEVASSNILLIVRQTYCQQNIALQRRMPVSAVARGKTAENPGR